MIMRCFDSWTVLAAFSAVYIILPFMVLRRSHPSCDKAVLILLSAGLGLAVQALLGFFWNHLLGRNSAWEPYGYYAFWLLALIVVHLTKHRRPPEPVTPISPDPLLPFIALIIMAAITLRSFDALDHASLGQSDAYTHLQFLRDVLARGQIRNIMYPPGYSWVLALPVMTFNLDAYLVARYVGPFFGALLVGTVYLIGRRHSSMVGFFAAFLAAVCPFLYPLIKTGMGAFANQLGLFFLLLSLYLYLSLPRRHMSHFVLIILGLAVSVPLFIFNLILLILLHRLLCIWTEKKTSMWWRNTILILAPFIIAAGLSAYHFLRPGDLHVTTTASLVTGVESVDPSRLLLSSGPEAPTLKERIEVHPLCKLAINLLTIKRVGLGSPILNGIAISLVLLFLVILIAGFLQACPALKLIGSWGLLTSLQTSTGLLEFSQYQRSGWSLMIAIALAGGVVMTWLWTIPATQKWLRPLLVLMLTALLIMAGIAPPQHRCISSGAEHELATVLRELSMARMETRNVRKPVTFEKLAPSPLITKACTAPHLFIMTRRYTLFDADQGNISDVLIDPRANLIQRSVEVNTRIKIPTNTFICFIDLAAKLPDMGFLARISPDLTQSLTTDQSVLYKPNEVILAFLKSLPANDWKVTLEERGANLQIYLAERQPH